MASTLNGIFFLQNYDDSSTMSFLHAKFTSRKAAFGGLTKLEVWVFLGLRFE